MEDVLNCLRDCPHSKHMWMKMNALTWAEFNNNNLQVWVTSQASGPNAVKFVIGLWGIWKWRNNMIFEDKPWSEEEAWRGICFDNDEAVSFLDNKALEDDNGLLLEKWLPPPLGVVKLNVDGSFHDRDNCMGGGGLLRDAESNWIIGFYSFKDGGNALTSEALAMCHDLAMAWNWGSRMVVCEVDCAELLAALEDEDHMRFCPKISDIQSWLLKDWVVKLNRVSRFSNAPADYLANLGANLAVHGVHEVTLPNNYLETLLLQDSISS